MMNVLRSITIWHNPACGTSRKMGITPRQLLREKGTPYQELGLGKEHWTDEQLIDQMPAHSILINRPIVRTPKGTRLCRPSETVRELL